jgi:hypothetical protein
MSFTITAQTKSYVERDDSHYVESTLSFGAPDNSFIIRGANPKSNPVRASVSRVLQKDVTVDGSTTRKSATVTIGIVTPLTDFTSAELDSLVTDIAEFITASTISELLMGKS